MQREAPSMALYVFEFSWTECSIFTCIHYENECAENSKIALLSKENIAAFIQINWKFKWPNEDISFESIRILF